MYINKDIKPDLLDPDQNDDKLEKENIDALGIISRNIIKMSGKILLISALTMGIGISFAEAPISPENAICQISIYNQLEDFEQEDELVFEDTKERTL